jgi:Zn finger protein HypA/HybF involved in hydrogenase expression
MRLDIEKRKGEIENWIALNQSKAFICRELKCKPETLNWWLNKMGLNYNGNKGGKGIKTPSNKKSALEYLSSDKHISAHRLRIKLIEDGIKEHKCEVCGLMQWNGKKIPLELHHIDGNRYNNTLENIQILCPNCHSQTDNNSGKNKGNY